MAYDNPYKLPDPSGDLSRDEWMLGGAQEAAATTPTPRMQAMLALGGLADSGRERYAAYDPEGAARLPEVSKPPLDPLVSGLDEDFEANGFAPQVAPQLRPPGYAGDGYLDRVSRRFARSGPIAYDPRISQGGFGAGLLGGLVSGVSENLAARGAESIEGENKLQASMDAKALRREQANLSMESTTRRNRLLMLQQARDEKAKADEWRREHSPIIGPGGSAIEVSNDEIYKQMNPNLTGENIWLKGTPEQQAQYLKWREDLDKATAGSGSPMLTLKPETVRGLGLAVRSGLPLTGLLPMRANMGPLLTNVLDYAFAPGDVNLSVNRAKRAATAGALTTNLLRYSAFETFSQAADKNLKGLEALAQRVADTGSPIGNMVCREALLLKGDPLVPQYRYIVNSVQQELQRLVTQPYMTGVSHETESKIMRELMSQNFTLPQLMATVRAARFEAKNRGDSFREIGRQLLESLASGETLFGEGVDGAAQDSTGGDLPRRVKLREIKTGAVRTGRLWPGGSIPDGYEEVQ